ncbi:LpxL/LpxP family Kdo(2)-lipid IV(A) lauroyl/palmitoleoyl acyltransferase [Aestuariibacter halophilus]|uniref:Lipid A biosynthesis acyltransferase n=1 Tax=Fluctibacter halophilus TaxID=226011 RepID=A0ABS8G2N6_9ALTE|nr:LpxL/LpxP family Kdo(2)-lipid IV(A) lauroyl/palmitoleoyl acyltransferase [Aestuariibacter halophilus]MCC2614842.1 LpxL/LpxP family Kdo(2)-lipid IV(A) lauroyl/palmitoleoyl acyltransferase [Aestuariibacter halophilus]
MAVKHVAEPPFDWRFLLPRYWLTWLSIGLLYLISWLPYRLQSLLGAGLGRLLAVVAKKRVAIARRNLALCFPHWTEAEREKVLKANVREAGMALLEASMGWWWPDWRVRRIGRVEGLEHVERIQQQGKGVLALATHNMSLELGCRLLGLTHPSVAFYRKHNNPLMEYMQYRGRARSNKYMIHKRDVKGLIRALHDGELCLYLPDQDYGPNKCEFVPFFDVKQTATTTGTLLFANASNCETVFVVSLRDKDGYLVKFLPGLENFPSGDDKQDVTRINEQVEKLVLLAPEQYLWMHKRFKTRPADAPESLY